MRKNVLTIFVLTFFVINITSNAQDIIPFKCRNGLMGCKDKQTGKVVVQCKYNHINPFSEGLAVVMLNGKFGYIDQTGRVVIPLDYDFAYSFSDGLAIVQTRLENESNYGCIDETGRIVIPLRISSEGSAKIIKERFLSYQFSIFAKKYIEEKIKEWEKKGEFEKNADWQDRVNETTIKKKISELTINAENAFISEKTKKIELNILLGKYDAENEVYLIKCNPYSDFLFDDFLISVPFSEAQDFKQDWKLIKKTPNYFIENDRLAIGKMTFSTKEGMTYTYINQNYSVTDISIESPKEETNIIASNAINDGISSQITVRENKSTPNPQTKDSIIIISTRDESFYRLLDNSLFMPKTEEFIDAQKKKRTVVYKFSPDIFIGDEVYFFNSKKEILSISLDKNLKMGSLHAFDENSKISTKISPAMYRGKTMYLGKRFTIIEKRYITPNYFYILEEMNAENPIILAWKIADIDNDRAKFILSSYYEKVKSQFIGKKYVMTKDALDRAKNTISANKDRKEVRFFSGISPNISNFSDMNTFVSVADGVVWTCSEVIVSYPYPERVGTEKYNDQFQQAFLILKNSKDEELGVRFKPWELSSEFYTDFFIISEDFIPYEKYLANINKQKQQAEQEAQKREEERVKNQQERERQLSTLTSKYGKELATMAMNGQIKIGMNKELCRVAWGNPQKVNKTTTAYGVSEQWVYSSNRYLYFEGETLTTIQN